MNNLHKDGALIALDWGTTNVRAALISADGTILEERSGKSGVGKFTNAEFAVRFDELTKGWPCHTAIAAGMIGSRQGWKEAQYLSCPTGVADLSRRLTNLVHGETSLWIVPGLKIQTEDYHDVMRGEETQIAGFLATAPNFSGTLVLPGSHSKWVRLKDGVIEKFTTYMTGEWFSALSQHTILSHAMALDGDASDGDALGGETRSNTSFQNGVRDVFVAKGSGWRQFFDLRAQTLLRGACGVHTSERLSGLLIGTELDSAAQDGYDIQDFILIGSGELVDRYQRAANTLDARTTTHLGTEMIWPALYALAGTAGLLKDKELARHV